jgi:hypothetical protein
VAQGLPAQDRLQVLNLIAQLAVRIDHFTKEKDHEIQP